MVVTLFDDKDSGIKSIADNQSEIFIDVLNLTFH